jgi:NitT/TauT family transport system substrate-binding protein
MDHRYKGLSTRHSPRQLIVLLLSLALLMAACGQDGDAAGSDPAPAGDEPTAAGPTAAADDDGAADETPASTEMRTVRVGYLHTLAVDSHMWLGIAEDHFANHGLELEPTLFNTGIALSQALAGGSLDLAIMGAVISNFPSRGQGVGFLANNVEAETAQIWAAPGSGIESVEDLEGQQVASVQGTTAHVLLYTALTEAGLDNDDVEFVNSDMATAVNAFLSGSVPALVTWAPNDVEIRERMPDATLLTTAGEYYPEAAILGGWVAGNEIYENDPELLNQVALAWLDINEQMMTETDEALSVIYEAAYTENLTEELVMQQFEQLRTFTNEEWAEQYESGQVTDWIGQVEQVFVEIGAFDDFVEPEEFFDSSIYLEAYEQWSG